MAHVYEVRIGPTRYVGSTSDLRSRISGHFSTLLAGKHRNIALQEAFNTTERRPEDILFCLVTEDIPLAEARWEENRRISVGGYCNSASARARTKIDLGPMTQGVLQRTCRELREEGYTFTEIAQHLGTNIGFAYAAARDVARGPKRREE